MSAPLPVTHQAFYRFNGTNLIGISYDKFTLHGHVESGFGSWVKKEIN
jgi:hypothetical protein